MPLSSQEVMAKAQKHLMTNVNRYPLVLDRGCGMKLWDMEGREYLDFLAGIATCALGYAPKIVLEAIEKQAAKLIHTSNYFYNEPMVLLAELLTSASGLDKAFFCNSGAEANESAIKLARKYSLDRFGENRYGIITATQSFHGRTLATISATGQDSVKAGFAPLLPGFTHVPYGDFAALQAAITEETCAIMLEPVQGEGGVVVPPEDYLPKVAALCAEKELLLILDEIQTGIGRTGLPFAFQKYDFRPHIMTLAKALGGGVASGAMLAIDDVAAHLTPGSHGTTVGGAPLAMSVGLAMVETIFADSFLENVRQTGQYFQNRLQELAEELPNLIKEVRGQGLLIGMELTEPSGPVALEMLKRGFLINATAGTVLRFAPPLIATPAEVDLLIPSLKETLKIEK